MKTFFSILCVCLCVVAEVESVPSTAVVVSTETVTKTVSREPRTVVLMFSPDAGEVNAEVTYETVTRVDGRIVRQETFKTVSMTWSQITNRIPSLNVSLVEFKAAAAASMTNTP